MSRKKIKVTSQHDLSFVMVKAPRSKGCRVCVERRIACDLAKPFCRKCKKSRRVCPGYQTYTIVDETSALRDRYRLLEPSPGPSSKDGEGATDNGTSCVDLAWPRLAQQSAHLTTAVTSDGHSFERGALISFLTPSLYQSQALSLFTQSIDPTHKVDPFLSSINHRAWLLEIAGRREISTCLTWSIRALSIAHLGRQTQDLGLIDGARSLYGTALRLLNTALQDPVEGFSADTLSATLLLSFYEILACTETEAWVRHAGGAGNLIRIRGPGRHRKGLGRMVLLSCRYSILMEALQTRRACFLNSPEWKRLFWDIERDVEKEDPRHCQFYRAREDIFTELVHIPEYLSDTVSFMAGNEESLVQLHHLTQQGRTHRSEYKRLHRKMATILKTEGQKPQRVPSRADDQLHPMVYEFPGILCASFYCGYWPLIAVLDLCLIGLERRIDRIENGVMVELPALRPTPADESSCALESQSQTHIQHEVVTTQDDSQTRTSAYADESDDDSDTENLVTMSTVDITSRRKIYQTESVHYAQEICRSYEHVSHSAFPGPIFLVNALRVAVRVLDGIDHAWCLRQLEKLGSVFGIAKTEVDRYKARSNNQTLKREGGPAEEEIWKHYDYVSG